MKKVVPSILSNISNFAWEEDSDAMKYDVPLALTYDIVNVWIPILVTYPVKTGSITISRGSFHWFLRKAKYVWHDISKCGKGLT